MVDVTIKRVNSVYNEIICDRGISMELADEFTFMVPGHKFMPKFKAGLWDGKIRLMDLRNNQIYSGLSKKIAKFCKARDYIIDLDSSLGYAEFSIIEAKEFIKSLNLPFEVRDYQLKTFVQCVRQNRGLVLSPTASGKSLIIYLLHRYYNFPVNPTLLIVPTTSLVHQMEGDFKQYGCMDHIHKIYSGQDKDMLCDIAVSTWQSIYKFPKEWFDAWGTIIVDEAHHAQAKSITTIMERAMNVEHRFGFTGTLSDSQCHEMVLEGLFGPIISLVTTSELIEQKHLSPLRVKCIVLKYSDTQRKEASKLDYAQEMDWLFKHRRRNTFIKNLALSLKGNTLVLFRYISHGQELHKDLLDKSNDNVYYVAGSVEGEAREEIRKIIDTHENSITVASAGVFSTGINIVHLDNIIFAAPSKSRIRVLQSIGRGLRKADSKEHCTFFDVSDDLTHRKRMNFSLRHFQERVQLYNKELFDYKIYQVNLKE